MELIYEDKAMHDPLILPQDAVEGGVAAEKGLSQTMGAIGPRFLMPTPYTHRGYKSGSHDAAEVAWGLRAVTPTYM